MKKKIRCILYLLFISMFFVSGYFLYNYYSAIKSDIETNNKVTDLIKYKEDVSVNINDSRDYSALYKENNDFIGWLDIDDTVIDYPVMQTKQDEEYYLHRNFYKQYSFAGTLFCNAISDIQKPSSNIIIYGGNMNAGTMFKELMKYEKEDFYKEHKYITFDTIYEYGTYEVIAAFRTDANDGTYEYYEFADGTEKDFNTYLNYATKRTHYKPESSATYGDKLISLVTCAYHTENGRFVVVAKQIESSPQDQNLFTISK